MFGDRWKRFWKSLGHLVALVALIGGCFLVSWEAWPRIGRWHKQRLAEQLAAEIISTPDHEVKTPIRQLAGLGTAALGPLVEAAASERATVAETARREIDLSFAALQVRLRKTTDDETDDETTEALIALATALAENVERFGPTGKQWAERIALSMIDQVDQFPAATVASLLSQCSLILDSIPPQGPRQQTVRTAVAPRQENRQRVSPPNVDWQVLATPSEQSFATFDEQYRLAQPLESTPVYTGPEEEPTFLTLPENGMSAALNGSSRESQPPALFGDTSLSVEVLLRQPSPSSTAESPLPKDVPRNGIIEVPTPLEMQRRLIDFRGMSTDSLLSRCTRSDRFETGAIRVVLAERGFQGLELQMAVLTKSADVNERIRVVDEVSALSAASARRLLRMLLGDESGEVRLRALTVLATSNDPGLDELARRIAVGDEDPRVAELATQLLRR